VCVSDDDKGDSANVSRENDIDGSKVLCKGNSYVKEVVCDRNEGGVMKDE
jgi:hypothetical protein